MLMNYIWVGIGGALGTTGRLWLSGWIANKFGQTFPWGTLVINVTGSFLIVFFARLTNPDPQIHGPAARTWSIYEGSCSTLLPSFEAVSAFAQDRTAVGLARIEAHYFAHDLFLPPGGLLNHMSALRNIPGEIVQGRYDMICPAQSAFELAAAWPMARLTLVPDAGHSALEPGVRTALIAALERCRSLT